MSHPQECRSLADKIVYAMHRYCVYMANRTQIDVQHLYIAKVSLLLQVYNTGCSSGTHLVKKMIEHIENCTICKTFFRE